MVFITDVNFFIYFKNYYYVVKRHESLDMAL